MIKNVHKPSSPVAQPQKAAVSEEGFERGLDALGHKKDSDKPTIGGERPANTNGRIPKVKAPKMTDAEQFEAFQKAAAEIGCDPDDERFRTTLRKLARPKG